MRRPLRLSANEAVARLHSKATAMHTRAMLQQLLPDAEMRVARGAEQLRAQEARVAALKGKGQLAEHSRKLLEVMKQTQVLQMQHVELLRRELAAAEQLRTAPPATDSGQAVARSFLGPDTRSG